MGCSFSKFNKIHTHKNKLEVPDIETIIECSKLCAEVYNIENDVFIKTTNKTKYIIIEGTDTFKEWMNNFACLRIKNDIHRGFLRYSKYCICKYELLKEINDNTDIERIVFSAHSLGAACVVISMLLLIPFIYDNKHIDIILFGCPRPGGKHLMERFQNEVINNFRINFRFVSIRNGNDIVCSIPPKCFGYKHVMNPIIISQTKHTRSCIKDHQLCHYTEALFETKSSNNITI